MKKENNLGKFGAALGPEAGEQRGVCTLGHGGFLVAMQEKRF